MTDLPKQYDPVDAQAKWFSFWESKGYFDADPDPAKTSHTIMIPLPNVTGALHMGHALNGTLQDLITRWKRMEGFEALWMPGTDHAGIATQAVVERRMFEEEGLTRHDVGRDALVNRIWVWKDQYEQRIIGQQKSLGASCDWRRTRFTLDDLCSKAVRRTFFRLFKDGLIFRGKRLVNWDTHLQTAVANDEVYHEKTQGHFWHIRYPVIDPQPGEPEYVTIATTRPETLLGDTAVAVHPDPERQLEKAISALKDDLGSAADKEKPGIEKKIDAIEKRKKSHLPGLIQLRDMAAAGRLLRLPLLDREIPLVADEWAKPELGSGCVKITPAHDHNDYDVGQRQSLPSINILNPDGTLNEEAGPYAGLTIDASREKVVADLAAADLLVEVEDREIEKAYSDRSKTAIEPYLSDQWFVKMGDADDGSPGLAQMAMDAVESNRVRFYPARYAKTYLDWLGEKRDWCISRQLWWGHRIPIWSRVESQESRARLADLGVTFDEDRIAIAGEHADALAVSRGDALDPGETLLLVCVADGCDDLGSQLEAAGFEQDPDVLDTWFSSALWPHATLGWPDTEHDPPLSSAFSNSPSVAGERSAVGGQSSADGNGVLPYFYPGSVLVTSRDIITLWVARMVLTGLYNMGDVPFRHVHVHPKILDGFGQTMSKSKGNGVDPLDLIDKYGTDAIRFTIASFAGETQDVRLPVEYECPHCGESIAPKLYETDTQTVVVPSTLKGEFPVPEGQPKPVMVCSACGEESQFTTPLYDADEGAPVARVVSERFEYGRNFCNKLWNASRFALMNLETGEGEDDKTKEKFPLPGYTPGEVTVDDLKLEDQWILSRLATTSEEVAELLSRYQFDGATRAIRDFTWNEFCDWYLEMIKPRLKPSRPEDVSTRPPAQRVLVAVLDSLLRLLHPFVPFITEELWQKLAEIAPERGRTDGEAHVLLPEPAAEACIVAPWPRVAEGWKDPSLESRFERLQETIVAVRNVRAVYKISPSTPVPLHVKCEADVANELHDVAEQFDNLAKAVLEQAGAEVIRPPSSAGFTIGDADGFIPLEGLIDREEELQRQEKERDKLRGFITGSEKKLANPNFVEKAPAHVVDEVRETLENLQKQLESVEQIIRDLGGE